MLEKVFGLEKTSLQQCESIAKKLGFDSVTFDLCGPKGRKSCRWLDAYMGVFQIIGEETCMATSQLEFVPDIWCENIMPEQNESTQQAPSGGD